MDTMFQTQELERFRKASAHHPLEDGVYDRLLLSRGAAATRRPALKAARVQLKLKPHQYSASSVLSPAELLRHPGPCRVFRSSL